MIFLIKIAFGSLGTCFFIFFTSLVPTLPILVCSSLRSWFLGFNNCIGKLLNGVLSPAKIDPFLAWEYPSKSKNIVVDVPFSSITLPVFPSTANLISKL